MSKTNQAMWGAHWRSVLNRQGHSVLFALKTPGAKGQCFIDFVADEARKEARDHGLFSEFEMRAKLKVKGLWEEARDEFISSTTKRIQGLRDSLELQKKGARQYKMTLKLIDTHASSLDAELTAKAQLFYSTIERYVGEARTSAAVYCSTYTEDDSRYWDSWNSFCNFQDLTLISNIVEALNSIDIIDTKEIREIARSPDWRYMWSAGKADTKTLFSTNICNMSLDQKNLLYWSQIYDSVYDAYERPPQSVIDDDDELDKWFEEQSAKSKKEALESSGKSGKVRVGNSVSRHGEVFVMTNPQMVPDTIYRAESPDLPQNDTVEELNGSFVRKFKEKEEKFRSGKGYVAEQDLRPRGDKIARRTIGSSDAVIAPGGFSGKSSGKSKILPGGTL